MDRGKESHYWILGFAIRCTLFVRDELHKTARLYDNVLYWSLYAGVEDKSSNGLTTSVTVWMFIGYVLSFGSSFLFLFIGVDTHPLLDGVFC